MIRSIAIVWLSFLCAGAGALPASDEVRGACIAAFEEAYRSMYNESWCHDNVKRLIEYFRQKRIPIDPSRTRVLYVYWPGEKKQLTVSSTRSGRAKWNYHVVLEYDGEIFDPDFTDKPHVVKKDKYFREMFLSAQPGRVANVLGWFSATARERKIQADIDRLLDTVRVRSMPAGDYVREGSERPNDEAGIYGSNFFWHGEEAERLHPSRTLRDYLGHSTTAPP